MRSALVSFLIGVAGCTLFLPGAAKAQAPDSGAAASTVPPAMPSARKVPGINAPDLFPNACVSCHTNMPERGVDARISTMIQVWREKVDPALLAKAQAAAPAGVTLKGKHPAATAALKDIPAGCIKCHDSDSKKAPPMARMSHLIHLAGGDENPFLAVSQGECTHCHKLNLETGAWSIPSAPEP
jgi:hypothetical protein